MRLLFPCGEVRAALVFCGMQLIEMARNVLSAGIARLATHLGYQPDAGPLQQIGWSGRYRDGLANGQSREQHNYQSRPRDGSLFGHAANASRMTLGSGMALLMTGVFILNFDHVPWASCAPDTKKPLACARGSFWGRDFWARRPWSPACLSAITSGAKARQIGCL
jgi:hypothetical protein